MTHRVVAIVQARMGSSRLPGKVLLDIVGRPMLDLVVTRAERANTVEQVVVATTAEGADDPIAAFCERRGIQCYRGSQFDVLDRYYRAARASQADIIVRITADCPAIDPLLIDDVVRTLTHEASQPTAGSGANPGLGLSFAANRLPPPWSRTYPIGLDVEACTSVVLERAWREATEPQQREHVMPFLYEGVSFESVKPGLRVGRTPRGFIVGLLDCSRELGHYRWTVDTAEDLEFIRQVFQRFAGRDDFSWNEILSLVGEHPELMQINAGVPHKALMDIDRRAGDEGPR